LENYGTGVQISFKPITALRDNRAYPPSDNHQLAAKHPLSNLARLQPVRGSRLEDNQVPKIKRPKNKFQSKPVNYSLSPERLLSLSQPKKTAKDHQSSKKPKHPVL